MHNQPSTSDNVEKEEKRRLLFWSTPESAEAGRFTVLALLETIAATSILIWLVNYTGNFKFILYSALTAPLLLLRTEKSTKLGIDGFDSSFYHMSNFLKKYLNFLTPLIFWLFYYPMILGVKIYAIAVVLIYNPSKSILSIPQNWWRISMATDTHHPPELMPGWEMEKDRYKFLENCSDFLLAFTEPGFPYKTKGVKFIVDKFINLFYCSLMVFHFLIDYSPPLIYRWSLKSTSILYLPLLWVLRPLSDSKDTTIQRLKFFAQADVVLLGACASVLGIGVFVVKFWLLSQWDGFADWVNGTAVLHTFSVYIEPTSIPRWQLVMFLNSVLMLGIFGYIRSCVLRYKNGASVNEGTAETVLKYGLMARRVMTFYTITCTLYLTAPLAMDLDWPALGDKWFPWG